MVKVSVIDKTAEVFKSLDSLKNMQVYVGVPEEKASRKDKDTDINNAELAFILTNGARRTPMINDMKKDVDEKGYHAAYDMYIQSHGSPLWQIPPRPIIEPAIENDKEAIAEPMGEALKAILDGNNQRAEEYLNKAGLEGQAAAQDWFTNPKNGWPANAQSTIDAKGSDKPNIDTGELRKAITYVVKKEV